ncbi:MAG TPA: membrane protein insertase YidC [Paenalcaligenes sp.]|nr:membrane protein insertase YidC [Paenalcaligenes sp.]
MDIRRTILWLIFAFSVLLLWNNWQTYNGRPSIFGTLPAEESVAQDQNSNNAQDSAETSRPDSDASIPQAQQPQERTADAQVPQEEHEQSQSELVHIQTEVFNLTFDTVGAQLIQADLLRYEAPGDKEAAMPLLSRTGDSVYLAQSGIIGADAQEYPNHLMPYRLVSEDNNTETGTIDIVFEAQTDAVRVLKTYKLKEDSYDIEVSYDIENLTDQPISPSIYFQLERDGNNPPDSSRLYRTFNGPVVYSDIKEFEKVSFSDLDKNKASYVDAADNGWIGFVQHYFATAWVPPQGVERKNEVLKVGENRYVARAIESIGDIEPNAQKTITAHLWVGPQDQQAMAELAPGLDLVVDYGWLTIISKPLFTILTWIHSLIGNWGWSIVVLTVLIKLIFYPLSAASYRSMARMKQVTPRMQALREKYGDDRAKLNQAMMELYRNEKINPLGGCLPMLVQIPVFIALYWVLLGSVEMRGAPWILWIKNLAAPDPYFILPAVMMATMFLQIRLNPTPPDPMQARIMMIMPLVFGGMMFFFPAGLVLYWVVNNALSIAQQQYITRRIQKDEAAKKVG